MLLSGIFLPEVRTLILKEKRFTRMRGLDLIYNNLGLAFYI